ncbi:hypothetical protein SAMN02745148_01550 [Modicisalibacter ilicicola DSM 19980]|uniref:Uncharacterized protein n=1 Tax=Modicisalibacter ilicicola DSM 19980 TaxID=1121942 RepID=A0A1M4Y198_9GAMM|nr:hypothetical protein [Halomonas ilicicola]SHE99607.1 hypothetical protein SAMN02745148_01550 [Halomonas ilicicola DSM 19980]
MADLYVIRNTWGGDVIARIAEPSKARTVQRFMSVMAGRELGLAQAAYRWIPWWWQGYRVVNVATLTPSDLQSTETHHGG